jgi:drug/metabolite transporter (DMT)-like permease
MCVIWGIPYLLIKVAVHDLAPSVVVFARTGIGAVVLVPLAAARRQLGAPFARWRALAVYTLVEIAGPWLFLSSAERRLSSSLSGLLVAAVPLVGAVVSVALRERDVLDARTAAGLVVGFGGVLALVGLDVGGADLSAVGAVGLVVVGYAVGPVLLARTLGDLPGVAVVASSLLLCAVGYAPFAVHDQPAHLPPARVLAAVLTLGVVCTAVAFVLFFHLIAEVGPLRATVITYVNPAVALVLGVAFRHEPFTAGAGLGFVLVVGGSVLASRRTKRLAGRPGPVGLPQIAEP